MAKLEYRKLTDAEVADSLKRLASWKVEGEALVREFEFKAYKDGVVFASAVGWLADDLNHHPDIYIGYAKVRVTTSTHDSGGLTSYDFHLASRIDALTAGKHE